jgi:hypothetical protein
MKPSPPSGRETTEAQKENVPAHPRPKNALPPLTEDHKELCALCRAGKLFAVQGVVQKPQIQRT